jgi:5'-methylthioadenosine phosphorylase
MTKIGIIGGSGLDNPDILENAVDQTANTRWGSPSTPLKHGTIAGVDVILLGRHGREHTITPTHVNYRANVQALKDSGCTHILATTAVGSLREDIGRGDLVILDQFIDFTKQRAMSFHEAFAPHLPVHTPMAEPFDRDLRAILIDLCEHHHIPFHRSGTVVTIEGPRFSTRAESRMFRAWGADVINMSVATEAALANEAGIPYAAVAMSTDYDCWKTDEAPVSWDAILCVFNSNARKVTTLLVDAIPQIAMHPR